MTATITLLAEKGSPLSHTEMDNNFRALRNLVEVPTVADLRALGDGAILSENVTVITQGCVAAGDGGGGLWHWDATVLEATPDNAGTLVKPTGHTGTGAWVRDFSGPVYLDWFGLDGTGATDNTAELQAALDAAAGNRLVFNGAKTYKAYACMIPHATELDLQGATVVKRPITAEEYAHAEPNPNWVKNWVPNNPAGSLDGTTVFWTNNSVVPLFYLLGNATIKNGTLNGNRSNDTEGTGSTWGGAFSANANRNMILASGFAQPDCKKVIIENIHTKDCVGSAFQIEVQNDGESSVNIIGCTEENSGNIWCELNGFIAVNTVPDPSDLQATVLIRECSTDIASDRVFNNVENVFLCTGWGTAVWQNNTFSGKVENSEPQKLQGTNNAIIIGNRFINCGIKGAASTHTTGKIYNSAVVANNIFDADFYQLPDDSINIPVCYFANYAMRNLTIIGNTFRNTTVGWDSASSNVNVSNNIMVFDTAMTAYASNLLAAVNPVSVSTLAIESSARTLRFFGNAITLPDSKYFMPFNLNGGLVEETIIENNVVSGGDNCFLLGMSSVAATKHALRLVGNRFSGYRRIGRLYNSGTMLASELEIEIARNSFLRMNSADSVAPWSGAVEASSGEFWHSCSASQTIDRYVFNDNTFDASNNKATSGFYLGLANSVTITEFECSRNWLRSLYASSYSFFVELSGALNTATFTNAYIKDNNAVKTITFAGSGTISFTNPPVINGNVFARSSATVNTGTVSITGYTSTAQLGETETTVGAAGGASALPATPTAYIKTQVGTSIYKIPAYSN